jgi:hypothetical protein
MATTWSICCRDHKIIAHISAGIGFWAYDNLEHFAHLSEHCATLNSAVLFNILHNPSLLILEYMKFAVD